MKDVHPKFVPTNRPVTLLPARSITLWGCSLALIAAASVTSLAGCGGGQGGGGNREGAIAGSASEQAYGPIVTRAVGTAQPPVSASVGNATVIGVAGAAFDTITQADTSPRSLADTKIAIARAGDNNSGFGRDKTDICVINVDGSGRKNLTNTPDTDEYAPAFSPDGTKIAFASLNRLDTVGIGSAIFVMNADGTNVKQTPVSSADYEEFNPAWSPDGKRIAFASNRDILNVTNGREVYVMNADGTNIVRLTKDSAHDDFPAWSPDGMKIAFRSDHDGNYEIYVMNADGSGKTRLSNNTVGDDYPAWAPDGSKIAFVSVANDLGNGLTAIWTMNADGSGRKQVTFPPSTNPEYADGDFAPFWARDGSGLGYVALWNGGNGLGGGAVLFGKFGPDGTIASSKSLAYGLMLHGLAAPSWSGYLARAPKKLVGTGGLMASAAAGFLFSQASSDGSRSKVASVVTFDTATANRVNTHVDKLSDSGAGSAAVFSVTAGDGALNNLRYLNGADGKVIQAVGTSAVPSAAGILVSFDGADGSVATVIPYSATKVVGRPTMKPEREGDTLVFRGEFRGVWNAKGENAAPQGARLVKIDAKTGWLIEAR